MEKSKLLLEEQPKADRQLFPCAVCGKLGYQYIRNRNNGRKYVYTIHSNEPEIGKYGNGQPKYRWCYDKGRIYESFDDAFTAVKEKHRKEKIRKQQLKIILSCPKCQKQGRLQDYNDKGVVKQVVVHEKIKGTWGADKVARRRRCWLGRKK